MNNKKLLMLALVSVLGGAACTRVPPGYVGIVVNQWGSEKGVSDYTAQTGTFSYNPITTSVFEYPTFMQNAVWTHSPNEGNPVDESISFTIANGMQVNVDISLAYELDAQKVPNFYVKFRNDDIKGFTHGFMRNVARDCFNEQGGKYTLEQVMGDNGEFVRSVKEDLQHRVGEYGVKISQFGIIGAPRPPQAVQEQINAKVKAQQLALQKENEVQQAKADATKRVAQAEGEARARIAEAEGQAKANQVLMSSMTPALLEWRRLALQEQALGKWNGTLPTYNGGGAVPFISIEPTK